MDRHEQRHHALEREHPEPQGDTGRGPEHLHEDGGGRAEQRSRAHGERGQDPRQIQGSFSLVDSRFGAKFGAWDVSLWGENLLDETYVQMSAVSNLFATDPAYQSFLGFGRSYGLGIRYSL